MPDDPLESVLRLVAEGRLSAEEAGPIIDALETIRPVIGATTTDDPRPADVSAASPGGGPGRAIRIEVTDQGRKVVNLRVPLALGRAALTRIPGLSEATAERIREAIETGVRGPIVDIDDEGDQVRIVVE
jgi:SHOCT-like protein